MNQNGNIIVTIFLVILIALIIYFAYYPTGFSSSNESVQETNPTDTLSTISQKTYTSLRETGTKTTSKDRNVKVTASIENTTEITIANTSIELSDNALINCSGLDINIKNSNIEVNTGKVTLNDEGVEFNGNVKSISSEDSSISYTGEKILNCIAKSKSIDIDNYVASVEQMKVNGTINANNVEKKLDDAYLKIEDYNGTAKLRDKTLTIDGLATLVSIVQSSTRISIE